MDYGDYYWGLYRDYYWDPFPHSLLRTRHCFGPRLSRADLRFRPSRLGKMKTCLAKALAVRIQALRFEDFEV